jgi:tryptophan synthase alpha chain
MSRVSELMKKKKTGILNIYCTAGFPNPDSTMNVIKSLEENGVDIIELGMPNSDPLADGEVIQASSALSLAQGMTISKLLLQLKDLRPGCNIPVILMGYMNPILQFGFEKFCAEAMAAGIDGLIIPDLPPYEFEKSYSSIVKKYGLDFIFLVTPETSKERVMQLDSLSSGFLYAVSSSSTTGAKKNMQAVGEYLDRLKTYN